MRLRAVDMKTMLLCLFVTVAMIQVGYSSTLDDPVPNQECGDTSTGHTTDGTSGEGSTGFTGPSGEFFAQNAAKSDMKKNLGDESGVVCGICPNGVQCRRTVNTGTGTTTFDCTDNGPDGWTCTATFAGSYSVVCAECIVGR